MFPWKSHLDADYEEQKRKAQGAKLEESDRANKKRKAAEESSTELGQKKPKGDDKSEVVSSRETFSEKAAKLLACKSFVFDSSVPAIRFIDLLAINEPSKVPMAFKPIFHSKKRTQHGLAASYDLLTNEKI